MQEIWAGNKAYQPIKCCPCIVNDDGSAIDEKDLPLSKISFFSQPASGYGEKPVSHVVVSDNHVYPSNGKLSSYPMRLYYLDYYGWIYTNYLYQSALNTVVETWWRGEKGDDPLQCSWFVRRTYTRPMYDSTFGVVFMHRETWCSSSYASEYNLPSTHFSDNGQYFMKVVERGQDLFYIPKLTANAAWEIYQTAAREHNVPIGLASELYRTAMNSITCNTNSIANILEVVGLIKDVRNGNFGALLSDLPKYLKAKELKKAASSSWLGYRYAYNTTKSDIAEYREKLLPLMRQKSGTHVVRSGLSTTAGTAHCKVVYTDRALNSAQKLYVMLKRTGLCLDAYNAWDMVPLSFVADWFLPIGDFLEDFSQNWVADSAIFDIATVTTSWKWSHTIQDASGWYDISHYSRSVTTDPPEFESYSEDPSTKTVLRRVVDAAALIVG